MSDQEILQQARERLASDNLDSSNIDVQVRNGEIILIGTVNSAEDKTQAESLLSRVPEVSTIHNKLTVGRGEQKRVEFDTAENPPLSQINKKAS